MSTRNDERRIQRVAGVQVREQGGNVTPTEALIQTMRDEAKQLPDQQWKARSLLSMAADALAGLSARDEALEEAAKVCESLGELCYKETHGVISSGYDNCVRAIRALKGCRP
jgi:hypothetical protein